MYSLPSLSPLYPKPKKRMKRLPTRSLTYWGIHSQEDCPEDDIHLQRLAWNDIITLHGYCASVHRGSPPPFLSIQHGGRASHGGRSPVYRSPAEVQAWLNLKCMTTLFNYIQKGWNKLPTRRFVPHEIQEGDFVPKRVLSVQPDSKGKWTPNYEGSCAMIFTTMEGGKLARPMKADAVKKYFVNMKSSVSRKY